MGEGKTNLEVLFTAARHKLKLSPSCIQSTGLSLLALAMLIMMLWLSVVSFARCCCQNKARLSLLGLALLWIGPPGTESIKANFLQYCCAMFCEQNTKGGGTSFLLDQLSVSSLLCDVTA